MLFDDTDKDAAEALRGVIVLQGGQLPNSRRS
jgi:hypothetical protein